MVKPELGGELPDLGCMFNRIVQFAKVSIPY
jgi:hypothetical protein